MTGPALPRILLVGAGVMGSHHSRVIAESARCDLVSVVDPTEDRGRKLARRFGARWMPKVESLAGVDAVVVASSTDQHRSIALDVLAEGIPLFVEKPLCASLVESREIVDTALSSGVPLMCGFIERFNPAVLEALSRVKSPSAVRTRRLSSYSRRMHAGVSWDLLVHDVDIAIRLLHDRSPKIINACTGRYSGEGRSGEDTVAALLQFSESRTAALSASRVSAQRVRQLVISDEGRSIVADLLNPSVTIYSGPDCVPSCPADESSSAHEILERIECSDRGEPLAAQCSKFVDLIEGKADASAEALSILPSHEMIAAILDSAEASAGETAPEQILR
ncbi:Gfo/Idh/MocA family oxidoreductase [Streptomyces sp. NBC_00466]|uniref:Gfo/Idh/MocA family protein n=1 Tax=Streptomyces sp. NBC_00466 TaxID=2903655 RepID=UPI0030DFFAE8